MVGSTSANPFSMMSYASPMDAPQLVQEIAQMQERLEAVETLMEEKPKAQVEKQPHQVIYYLTQYKKNIVIFLC